MNPSLFNPSPEDTDRVLHRFADHEVTFHDIADEFKTTVPALVLWLAKPEIAQRIADLRSAGAERTRTIAALYLPRTIPVLMRIIDSHDYDIGHRLDDPRDPATPILQLRERESVRKAITLIYRLANFTDKPAVPRVAVPRVARASELPVRSAPDPSAPPVASASSRCREPAGPTRALTSKPASPLHAEGVVVSSPALPRNGTPGHGCPEQVDPIGVVVASNLANTADPLPTNHQSLTTNHPSTPFAPSHSSPNTPTTLLQCAGTASRRSRAGPTLLEVA